MKLTLASNQSITSSCLLKYYLVLIFFLPSLSLILLSLLLLLHLRRRFTLQLKRPAFCPHDLHFPFIQFPEMTNLAPAFSSPAPPSPTPAPPVSHSCPHLAAPSPAGTSVLPAAGGSSAWLADASRSFSAAR